MNPPSTRNSVTAESHSVPVRAGEPEAAAAPADADHPARLDASFTKRFTAEVVITGEVSTPADRFSITVLFGPSGCGKTTILRSLAGLERPEEGRIAFANETWLDAHRRVFLPPQRRNVGMLFQDYALFPHLRVAENVGYALRDSSRDQRRRRVGELLERFGLAGLERRFVHQISGGQQQRVALARAVARRPRLLLLDEPLSALDEQTRSGVRRELRRMLADLAIPVVLVTHDRTEAAALADQIVVLDAGRILQAGPAGEVFARPHDRRVADIVGVETVLPGELLEVRDGLGTVAVGQARLTAVVREPQGAATGAWAVAGPGPVHICIRAEQVMLETAASGSITARNQLPATIRTITSEGPLCRVELDAGFPLLALVTHPAREELQLHEGRQVWAVIKAPAVHLLPA